MGSEKEGQIVPNKTLSPSDMFTIGIVFAHGARNNLLIVHHRNVFGRNQVRILRIGKHALGQVRQVFT